MLRPSHRVLRAAVIGGLIAVHLVAVGRDGDRKATNTFILVTPASGKAAPPRGPSPNGVGVAPAQPVVSNPYQVPLLQNAGTLRSTR
jgi:hypothetical protein